MNFRLVQNYLKDAQMPDHWKILYRPCFSTILHVMTQSFRCTRRDLNDLQRPTNCIELLSLMLNHVKKDLTSTSLANTSNIRQIVLSFVQLYAYDTIFIPDLIEAGCVEIMINGLIKICK